MKTTSKRWRRNWRNRFRRTRKKALALAANPPQVSRLPINETEIARFNRVMRWLNSLVRYPREKGYPLIDGAVYCPRCKEKVFLMADPQEWQRRRQPRWRRDDGRGWKVLGYWGGTAQCCGLLLAFQSDGQLECYSLDQP